MRGMCIALTFSVLFLSSCSKEEGEDIKVSEPKEVILGSLAVCEELNKEECVNSETISNNTNKVHATIKISQVSAPEEVVAKWYYLGPPNSDFEKVLIGESSMNVEGDDNLNFVLEKPKKGWLVGGYEVEIRCLKNPCNISSLFTVNHRL